MLEELKQSINNEKEVLSVLPQNNLRNRKKYREKLQELIDSYSYLMDKTYEVINEKYNAIINVDGNKTSVNSLENADKLYDKLYLFNKYNTSYEKMGLDYIIYNLRKYYKNNLDEVNNNINLALEKFAKVGLQLTADDFFFSTYAHEYMQVFVEEKNNGNYNSSNVKEEFEKIYWKCPDIIMHILLNITYIYYNNKKKIDKYFVNLQNDVESELGNYGFVLSLYQKHLVEYNDSLNSDKELLLNKFLNDELNINDYTEEKIEKLISQLIDEVDNQSVFYENLNKFVHSLIEYKGFLGYEYIVNDIKSIYLEKDKYKDAFKNKYKEIAKKEKNIRKLNAKVNWCTKRNKAFDKIEVWNNQINNEIHELEKLYLELDNEMFKEKVLLNINENSTIHDVLFLASSYYNYIIDCNKRNNIEVSSTTELIKEIKTYLCNPYNTIISNLLFNRDENKAMIIGDKYKLMNFKLELDMLDISNIDALINTINSIILYYNLLKMGFKIDELIFVCDAKKIIQSKEESKVAS